MKENQTPRFFPLSHDKFSNLQDNYLNLYAVWHIFMLFGHGQNVLTGWQLSLWANQFPSFEEFFLNFQFFPWLETIIFSSFSWFSGCLVTPVTEESPQERILQMQTLTKRTYKDCCGSRTALLKHKGHPKGMETEISGMGSFCHTVGITPCSLNVLVQTTLRSFLNTVWFYLKLLTALTSPVFLMKSKL